MIIPKHYVDKMWPSHVLKSSFEEIVNLMDHFAAETQKEHPYFEYEKEMITSRKSIFKLYENEKQVTLIKKIREEG